MVDHIVCVQIMDEPVDMWREVPARKISDFVYVLEGYDIYDPEDEKWEFAPGTKVLVRERLMGGLHPQTALVAIKAVDS